MDKIIDNEEGYMGYSYVYFEPAKNVCVKSTEEISDEECMAYVERGYAKYGRWLEKIHL